MKYQGFDGREHTINFEKFRVFDNNERPCSSLHLKAREILKRLYPLEIILEEVTLPGSKKNGKVLYADFFIPAKRLIVEVHGEQHYKFNAFFFKTEFDFKLALKRDKDKREWCALNNITIVELAFNESDRWEQQITGRFTED